MSKLRTIEDLGDLTGKTVIVRSDLDVPVVDGEVAEGYRVRKSAITIRELINAKAKVVVIGHLGRPEGKYVDEMSLMPVRFELGKLLDSHIKFAHIPQSRNSIRYMEDGEVILLENVRFHPGEQSKDKKEREEFVAELAELGDFYVNDAFGTYRDPSASTVDLAKMFDKPAAGIQMQKEVERLGALRDDPKKPYVAIIGGAKLDSKIPILNSLISQADQILIGGAMAYTFLTAQGVKVGNSKVEKEMVKEAEKILKAAKKKGCEILLPIDHICGKEFEKGTKPEAVDAQEIPNGMIGLDVGPKTLELYKEAIIKAKSILWNGPMGVFEWEDFAAGTEAIGEYVGRSAPKSTYKVAGGGDTVAAMDKLLINMKNFNHVSTGGGAMLAFLAGEKIAAIEALYK